MPFEPKDLSGVLFKNDRKTAGSKQPDYKGKALIQGVNFEMAGWIKEGARGPFLSLSFQLPRDSE